MSKKILISTSSFGKVDNTPLKMLTEAGFEVTLNPHGKTMSQEQSIALLEGMDGLIAGTEKLDAATFDAHPNLKYICRLGTGMNSVDLAEAANRGIPVENTPSAHVDGVAELALAGILDIHRDISVAHTNMKKGVWKKPMGSLLKGKTIGLIGLGKVSKRLVELLKPFGVTILAQDLYWDDMFAQTHDIKQVDLKTLCEKSDVVSIHIPYTPENHHIIGDSELSSMKPTAKVVNTSRGGLIDENALISFLNNNTDARAYLDTFEVEPYYGALLHCDNLLVTPHIGSYAREVRLNMEIETAQKTIAFFSGKI